MKIVQAALTAEMEGTGWGRTIGFGRRGRESEHSVFYSDFMRVLVEIISFTVAGPSTGR